MYNFYKRNNNVKNKYDFFFDILKWINKNECGEYVNCGPTSTLCMKDYLTKTFT